MEIYYHFGSNVKIQIANISDSGYLGIHETIAKLGPLLRQPECNPRATLITPFLNAIPEIIHRRGEKDTIPTLKTLMDYLPKPSILSLASPRVSSNQSIFNLAIVID